MFRGKARQEEELQRAYEEVFLSDAGQMVLADLAEQTNFYFAADMSATGEERAFRDGLRTAFFYIHRRVIMTDETRALLERAVRQELEAKKNLEHAAGEAA